MKIVVPADKLAKAALKHLLPAAQRYVARIQEESKQKIS